MLFIQYPYIWGSYRQRSQERLTRGSRVPVRGMEASKGKGSEFRKDDKFRARAKTDKYRRARTLTLE